MKREISPERHTYKMGVIGNCSYMAYIDQSANVCWMCWPRFDSSFIFGNLIDERQGGYFYIRPYQEEYLSEQYYITNTNILCTQFKTEDGVFRVIDFAPRFLQFERYFKPLMLVRIVEPIEGHPRIRIGCKPVGGYGKIATESYLGSNHIRYLGLDRPLRLTTDFPKTFILDERAVTLETSQFSVLTYGIPLDGPIRSLSRDFMRKTREYWQGWVKSSAIPPHYQEEVLRSALILKLHQFEDTGGIIASGSTSLPESQGEGRNWDYRFCWMRDSYYTLRSVNHIGHFEELIKYSRFIQNVAVANGNRFQPLYPITGNPEDVIEKILDLDGYKGNKPVRIGNQASEHIQNDTYGQVLVSLLPIFTDKRFVEQDKTLAIRTTKKLLSRIEETIDEPDAGLWEFRNKQQKHCYTFLFHWAGSHAAAKIGSFYQEDDLVKKAKHLVIKAAENIESCYDPEEKVYRQASSTKNLDASLFQLITMRYLDPSSEKAKQHLIKLEQELKYKDYLFFRYKHKDDFGTPKSTFLVCAFWYIEALACVGRVQEAKTGMDFLLKYSNHLGLFSEDIDPETGGQLGNFPQTYSHVGLMNAAFMISYKLNQPDFLVY